MHAPRFERGNISSAPVRNRSDARAPSAMRRGRPRMYPGRPDTSLGVSSASWSVNSNAAPNV
eukprot:1025773-Pleurochrysis_carterae.AAC.2